MARIMVPLANGIYDSRDLRNVGNPNDTFYHQVSFDIDGTPTQGVVEIRARAPESSVYEIIPDGVVNLIDPKTLLFQFNTDSFQFTVTGSDVTDGFIIVNDQELRGI